MTSQSGKARGSPGIASGPLALVIGQGEPTARLNLKYLFDTFVISAPPASPMRPRWPRRPRRPTPPVQGESGLGKTRLLHAIGHYARSLYLGTRVRYVSSEEFTNKFISSIRDGKDDSFRKRYREMDI
ncbi:DnaA ATPase domain-containing protein, partial [Streptomyces resistomycificus]